MGVFSLILSLYEDNVVLAVEDGRIRFDAPTGALSAERMQQLRERRSEVIAFLQEAPFQTRVLSYNMERILDQTSDGVAFSNSAIVLEFLGELDIAALCQALESVGHRHASLRTHLQSRDGDTYQTVLTSMPFAVEVKDVSATSAPLECALSMLRDMVRAPFNRSQAPMLRAAILAVGRQRHIAGIVVDHLVFDGASSAVLLLELRQHYLQLKSQGAPGLGIPRQYYDFSMAQRIAVKGQWQHRIAGRVAALVPYYSVGERRSHKMRYTTCSDQFHIGVGRSAALAKLSERYQVTPYTVVWAAYALTLAVFLQRRAVAVWTVAANRDDPLSVGVIGFCVNPLPIWVTVDPAVRCVDFLQQAWEAYSEAMRDCRVPVHSIGKALLASTGERLEALEEFGINLNYGVQVAAPTWTDSLSVTPFPLHLEDPKTWYSRVYLWMTLSDSGVYGTIAYCRETFPSGEHREFVKCMDEILSAMILRPMSSLRDLGLS